MYYREHRLHIGLILAGCGLEREEESRGHTQHSWVKKRAVETRVRNDNDDVMEKNWMEDNRKCMHDKNEAMMRSA